MRTTLLLLLLAAIAGSARADSPADQAKVHLATAQRMFQVQQYDKAIAELQEAYVLDPKPEYLYAIAQAFRMAGDCTKAIRGYEQYLKTNPVAAEAEKARANIERCKTEGATPPVKPVVTPPPPVTPPPVAAPPVAPAPPHAEAESPSWTHDYVGHALVGGGIVLAIVGPVLYVSGRSTINSINSAASYDMYASRHGDLDGARLKQRVGIGAMIAGGALVIGGVLHYTMSGHAPSRTVSASVGTGSAVLVLEGAF